MIFIAHTCVYMCLYQPGIYKSSLTNISQSNYPINFPDQKDLYSPDLPYLIPIQLYKLSAYLLLIPSLRLLAYILLPRACHYVSPHTRKLKANTRFRERQDQTHPHVAEYCLSHFPYRAEASCLVFAFV